MLNCEMIQNTFYETLESKLKNMYHISSRVPEGEEYLKPNIPKIRKNFNHAFLYATSSQTIHICLDKEKMVKMIILKIFMNLV